MADLPTVPPNERDLFKIVAVLRQTVEFLSRQPAMLLGGWVQNVNLNSANTDNAITITAPKANYYLHSVLVKNKGTTASITTATAGLFTAAGGGGTALAPTQALSGLTSNAVNTAGGLMFMTMSSSNQWANRNTLYFRIGTAQGAAATADVYVFIQPLP